MKARDRYDSLLQYYAERQRLDWRLLKAQMLAESGGNPDAVSPARAVGLAQFMRATWREWWDGKPGMQGVPRWSRRNPEAAIRAQAAYVAWLREVVRGLTASSPWPAVLAAYNWGIARVRRALVSRGSEWRRALPLETRLYLARVARYYRALGGEEWS